MIRREFEKKLFWYISKLFLCSRIETEGKRGGTSELEDNMTEIRTGILQNAGFFKMSTGHGLL
jgi:hypothetical protein